MAASLFTLPYELLNKIAGHLDICDLVHFRATSRDLNSILSHQVDARYEVTLRVMRTSESLMALRDVVADKTHSKYLRNIQISNDHFPSYIAEDAGERMSDSQRQAWEEYGKDQSELRRSGRDVELLSTIFKSLGQIRELSLGAPPLSALYYPYSEPTNTYVRTPSTGWKRVLDTCGCPPQCYPLRRFMTEDVKTAWEISVRDVLDATLEAVANSKVRVKELEILPNTPRSTWLPIFKAIPETTLEALREGFAGLEYLHLYAFDYDVEDGDYPNLSEPPKGLTKFALSSFLATMPALRALHLLIHQSIQGLNVFHDLTTRSVFPCLKFLVLEDIYVCSSDLEKLLENHSKLEGLGLYEIHVQALQDWTEAFQAILATGLRVLKLSRLSFYVETPKVPAFMWLEKDPQDQHSSGYSRNLETKEQINHTLEGFISRIESETLVSETDRDKVSLEESGSRSRMADKH